MQTLNLDQLRTFLVVVRQGGVNRAARYLNLSQPAVTARIRNLEAAIGRPLFDRHATGLRPTRAAERLIAHAERFELLASLVEREVADTAATARTIRIGASETVTQTWLPDFISRLHEGFPAMTVDLTVDISLDLRRSLLDREIDLAFLLGPVSEPTVENVVLPPFDLGWYARPDAVAAVDGPARLLERPVITYLRGTRPFRELRSRLIEEVGPAARIFTSSSLSAIFRLVEAGIGVAALPRAMAGPPVAAGRVAEFDPGWCPAPLQFTASWVGEPPDPVVERLTEVALEVASGWRV